MNILLRIMEWMVSPAHAVSVTDAINIAGNGLGDGGGSTIGDLVNSVAGSFEPIIIVAATLAIFISGFFLTVTGNESQVTTAKRVFIGSIAAIVLVNVGTAFVNALISGGFSVDPSSLLPSGTTILSNPLGSGGIISAEALGLLEFIAAPLGIICVLMIIISGVRAMANFGSEDGVTQLRRTVLFVVIGFALVASRVILGGTVTFSGLLAIAAPTNIITRMVFYISRIIGVLVTLAIGIIVYAGILMIANIGSEDVYSKAKGLIIRVAIGLIILLASGGIVIFFMNAICAGAGPCG